MRGDGFDWELHKEMAELSKRLVSLFLKKNRFANQLSLEMNDRTSTRFIDWVDHLIVPDRLIKYKEIESAGLVEIDCRNRPDGSTVLKNPRSYLFPILISKGREFELALKPESIEDFLQYLSVGIKAEGEPFSNFRKAMINKSGNYLLTAVERRGYDGFIVKEPKDTDLYIKILSDLYSRNRHFDDDEEGFKNIGKIIKNVKVKMDDARVSDAFFRSERAYWQRRNRAGQVQKSRQDSLGLGWGNQDHHTFRSSRKNFTKMVNIFEQMGYKCRERYYAGEVAGWGAQILEHKVCDIVVFTDVDLNASETEIDFAHSGFGKDSKKLGTVGLWTGLHGESILEAGMHHLEARFDFEKLNYDLPKFGIDVMPPFSYFVFLKQAFTVGERWSVERKRLDRLLKEGKITKGQYSGFIKNGAIGSHMENLERNLGFKGFNKSSVTKIIIATDPRKHSFAGA